VCDGWFCDLYARHRAELHEAQRTMGVMWALATRRQRLYTPSHGGMLPCLFVSMLSKPCTLLRAIRSFSSARKHTHGCAPHECGNRGVGNDNGSGKKVETWWPCRGVWFS